jgi:type VI protein secretion system component Hcp
VPAFLKLAGIPGDSAAEGHEGEIELLSYSVGVSSGGPRPERSGPGIAIARRSLAEFELRAAVGAASPTLLLAALQGRHIPTAVLSIEAPERPGSLVWTLTDVTLTDYRAGSPPDGAGPDAERFSMTYGRMSMEYRDRSGEPVTATYDLRPHESAPGLAPAARSPYGA